MVPTDELPGLNAKQRQEVREIAAEEARAAVASFAGLGLRRFQEASAPDAEPMPWGPFMSKVFGEALNDFSSVGEDALPTADDS